MDTINKISKKTLGIIAGSGQLPTVCGVRAKELGYSVVCFAHKGHTEKNLSTIVDQCHWFKVGKLGAIIESVKSHGISEIIFAGGINRVGIFGMLSLDSTARRIIMSAKTLRDDELLRSIAHEFESNGIKVLPTSTFVPPSNLKGCVTKTKFSTDSIRDAIVGWRVAKELGRLDVGQTVIAHQGTIVAVEAIEGTDQAILRAGELTKDGSVVVKCAKDNQDLRFDLPTIGIKTVHSLRKARAAGIVLERGRSIIIDESVVISALNKYSITLVLADSEDDLEN